MITHLSELLEISKRSGKKTIAVAAAHDKDVLQAVTMACENEIAEAILVGHKEEILGILKNLGKDTANYQIVEADTDSECAEKAVELIRNGKAQFLMKGILSTGTMMRAVIDREHGIRGNSVISSVMLLETEKYPKILCLTDGGMIPFPSYDQKKAILKNAAQVMKCLGYGKINAACVCGSEEVNPKIQATVDAQKLSSEEEWKDWNMNVFGPVGMDMAISKASCLHKHYSVEGGGEADILLVPTYEVGNGIGKAMLYFANTKNAGIIVGAQVPIILVSRSDPAESKLASIALASIVSNDSMEA